MRQHRVEPLLDAPVQFGAILRQQRDRRERQRGPLRGGVQRRQRDPAHLEHLERALDALAVVRLQPLRGHGVDRGEPGVHRRPAEPRRRPPRAGPAPRRPPRAGRTVPRATPSRTASCRRRRAAGRRARGCRRSRRAHPRRSRRPSTAATDRGCRSGGAAPPPAPRATASPCRCPCRDRPARNRSTRSRPRVPAPAAARSRSCRTPSGRAGGSRQPWCATSPWRRTSVNATSAVASEQAAIVRVSG